MRRSWGFDCPRRIHYIPCGIRCGAPPLIIAPVSDDNGGTTGVVPDIDPSLEVDVPASRMTS